MTRKHYGGIAILIILVVAVAAYLAIPKHVETELTEPPQTKKTAQGHWHLDAAGNRVWHAEPHGRTKPEGNNSTAESKETDSDIDAEIAELDAEIAELDAEIAELDAEYEAREIRIQAKAAYIKHLEAEAEKRKALEKEATELSDKVDKIEIDFMANASELLPVFSMSYDDFHNTYPTVAARKEVAIKFATLEKHRLEIRDLFENSSPEIRKMLYGSMADKGTLDLYKRVFLPDEVIKDKTLKALIAEHAERKGR